MELGTMRYVILFAAFLAVGAIAPGGIAAKHPREASVEWIMEGPSGGLLSDFGTVGFSNASATINGRSGGLSSLSNPDPITMVSSKGAPRVIPSSPSHDSFTVTWEHS